MSLFAGIGNEKRSTGNYQLISTPAQTVLATLVPADTTVENSAFIQLDWNVQKWRFVVGARYTDNDKSGASTTPRLAAVYQLDEIHSFKFLHSEGFNSPNFVQQLISIPNAITGHEDLNPEVIKSTDIAWSVR